MLIQLVSIEVRAGARDTFLEAFRLNCIGTRQEPGNIHFDLLNDPENDHKFYAYEIFRDEAALEAHRQTPHYKKCVEIINPITIGGRGKQYFRPVDIEMRRD